MLIGNASGDLHSENCILEQKLGPIVDGVGHRETKVLSIVHEAPHRQRLDRPCAQECIFLMANPYSHPLVALSILTLFAWAPLQKACS